MHWDNLGQPMLSTGQLDQQKPYTGQLAQQRASTGAAQVAQPYLMEQTMDDKIEKEQAVHQFRTVQITPYPYNYPQ